jgi:hypothetical protein
MRDVIYKITILIVKSSQRESLLHFEKILAYFNERIRVRIELKQDNLDKHLRFK